MKLISYFMQNSTIKLLLFLSALIGLGGMIVKSKKQKITNPQVVVTDLNSEKFSDGPLEEFLMYISNLDKSEFQALVQNLINFNENGSSKDLFRTSVGLIRWFEVDSGGAVTSLLSGQIKLVNQPELIELVIELVQKYSSSHLSKIIATIKPENNFFTIPNFSEFNLINGVFETDSIINLEKKDPLQGLKKLRQLLKEMETHSETEVPLYLISTISTTHPEEAARFLIEYDHLPEVKYYGRDAVREWAKINPLLAIATIEQMPRNENKGDYLESAFISWAEIEPKLACEYAWDNIEELGVRRNVITSALGEWMDYDTDSAFEFLVSLPQEFISQYDEVFSKLLENEPEKALNTYASITDLMPGYHLIDQIGAMGSLVKQWAEKDLNSAMNWVLAFPKGKLRDQAIFGIVKVLANSSPQQTAQLIGQIEDRMVLNSSTDQLVNDWSMHSPQQAMEWLTTLPLSERRNSALKILAKNWSLVDPIAAANGINSDLPVVDQKEYLKGLLENWSKVDLEGSFKWLQSQNREVRFRVYNHFLLEVSSRDPQKALQILKKIPQEDVPKGPYYNVFKELSESSLDLAIDELSNIQNKLNHKNATHGLVKTWLREDFVKAEEWMNKLMDGKSKDIAFSEMVKMIGGRDFSKSLDYFVQITDSKIKQDAFRYGLIVHSRTLHNPQQIREKVKGMDQLTTKNKSRLLSIIK